LKLFNMARSRVLSVSAAALTGTVVALALAAPASAHTGAVEVDHVKCDESTGNYLVYWNVTNNWKTDATLSNVSADPASVDGVADKTVVKAHDALSQKLQIVPGTAKTASLSVTFVWSDMKEQVSGDTGRRLAGNCMKTVVGVPTASLTTACDALSVTVMNPTNGMKNAVVVIKTNKSPDQTVTLQPGETKTLALTQVSASLTGTVMFGTTKLVDIAFVSPANCAKLPVTGTKTDVIVGVAIGLLLLGGVLFVLARRRRVTFTS
jgi:LPXTG-motif cell wall-anchored protein